MKDFLKKPTLYIIIIIILVILLLLKSCGPGGSGLFGGKDTVSTKQDSTKKGKDNSYRSKNTTIKTTKKPVSLRPTKLTDNDLNTVSRYGAGVFITAGDNGKAFLTGNGGINWDTLNTGVTDNLHGSAVLNYYKMLLAGNNGKILRSVNMGRNWSVMPSTTTKDLNSLNFTDTMNGYAVGKTGTVIKTNDGGATWNTVNIADSNTLNSVSVYGNTIWIAGNSGALYKSNNNGTNWSKIVLSPAVNIYGISFDSLNYGIAVGDGGNVFTTTNGGVTWTNSVTSPAKKLLGVHVVSPRLAYIVGNKLTIRVDNGVKKYLDTINNIKAVDPSPYFQGIIAGEGGIIGDVGIGECNNCDIPHDLVFFQISETQWRLSIRVEASIQRGNMLRIVTPGFELTNTVLNGWTEMDNVQGNGNPRMRFTASSSQTQGTGNISQPLPDYADVDLRSYFTSSTNLSSSPPLFIQLNYDISMNPVNASFLSGHGYAGQFQYYYTDADFSADPALGSDFCHYITYQFNVPAQ